MSCKGVYLMRYRVQGLVAPIAGGVLHVSTEPFYEWYQEAESHLDAAGKFILDHPEVNQSPLLVCDEDYVMGNYPLEQARLKADYLVGLRS